MPFVRHGPTIALLAMVLLAVGHVGLILLRDYEGFLQAIQEEVRQPTDGFAAATESYFARYLAALEAVSEAPCVRARRDCGTMFADLKRRFPGVVNFAALDKDGRFFNSSIGLPSGQAPSAALAEFFVALRDGSKLLHVMDPHVGPISAERVTGLIIPLRDASGGFDGAVGVSLRFGELQAIWQALHPSPGVGVLVTDRKGAVIFMEPGGSDFTLVPPAEVFAQIDSSAEAPFSTVSANGRSWYAYRATLPALGWTVAAVHSSNMNLSDYLGYSMLPVSLLPPTVGLAILGLVLSWRNWRHVGELERRVVERTADLTASNLELAASNVRLRQANEELETFVWVASHDLREPLRAVSTHVTLLERRATAELDDEARGFIRVAREAAKRLDRLVLDLLDYASIGRISAPSRAVETMEAAQQACRKLSQPLGQAGALVSIAPDMPTVVARHGDVVRLFEILIRNAVDHRHPERVPRIEIGAESDGESDGGDWRLWVTDNGRGIEPAYFDKIFALFQRLHPADNPTGTGAGLTICRKIARYYGGDIHVESEPGTGSRFMFTLPGATEEDKT